MRESLQLLFDSLCLKLESKELELCSWKGGDGVRRVLFLSSVFLHFAACEGRGIAWLAESEGKGIAFADWKEKRNRFFILIKLTLKTWERNLIPSA
jgi:hypothetical protein